MHISQIQNPTPEQLRAHVVTIVDDLYGSDFFRPEDRERGMDQMYNALCTDVNGLLPGQEGFRHRTALLWM